MTLKSMTGFGQGNAEGNGLRVDVEISSVNRKQLDVMINLPRSLQSLEPWVQEQLSHQMSRGRINLQIGVQYSGSGASSPVSVNRTLAESCLKELRATAKKLSLNPEISLRDLIRIPGIIVVQEAGQDLDRVKPVLQKALSSAVKKFMAMRKREGESLLKDLSSRMDKLESYIVQVAARAPGLVAGYRKALQERVRQLAGELHIPDERLDKEVILFADRADITEEITRLQSHIKQARGMFRMKEPAGRAMDFLAQEMFREINTIGSKANDSGISSIVVNFKADLERFREQVQNIE